MPHRRATVSQMPDVTDQTSEDFEATQCAAVIVGTADNAAERRVVARVLKRAGDLVQAAVELLRHRVRQPRGRLNLTSATALVGLSAAERLAFTDTRTIQQIIDTLFDFEPTDGGMERAPLERRRLTRRQRRRQERESPGPPQATVAAPPRVVRPFVDDMVPSAAMLTARYRPAVPLFSTTLTILAELPDEADASYLPRVTARPQHIPQPAESSRRQAQPESSAQPTATPSTPAAGAASSAVLNESVLELDDPQSRRLDRSETQPIVSVAPVDPNDDISPANDTFPRRRAGSRTERAARLRPTIIDRFRRRREAARLQASVQAALPSSSAYAADTSPGTEGSRQRSSSGSIGWLPSIPQFDDAAAIPSATAAANEQSTNEQQEVGSRVPTGSATPPAGSSSSAGISAQPRARRSRASVESRSFSQEVFDAVRDLSLNEDGVGPRAVAEQTAESADPVMRGSDPATVGPVPIAGPSDTTANSSATSADATDTSAAAPIPEQSRAATRDRGTQTPPESEPSIEEREASYFAMAQAVENSIHGDAPRVQNRLPGAILDRTFPSERLTNRRRQTLRQSATARIQRATARFRNSTAAIFYRDPLRPREAEAVRYYPGSFIPIPPRYPHLQNSEDYDDNLPLHVQRRALILPLPLPSQTPTRPGPYDALITETDGTLTPVPTRPYPDPAIDFPSAHSLTLEIDPSLPYHHHSPLYREHVTSMEEILDPNNPDAHPSPDAASPETIAILRSRARQWWPERDVDLAVEKRRYGWSEEQEQEEAPTCAICVEKFRLGNWATELPCGHEYCSECIIPWLESSGTCPSCRARVEIEDPGSGGVDDDTLNWQGRGARCFTWTYGT